MQLTTQAATRRSSAASSRLRPPPPEKPNAPRRPGSTLAAPLSTSRGYKIIGEHRASERRAGALDETDQIGGCPTRTCRARVRGSPDVPSRWPEPDPSSTQHEAKQHAGESYHRGRPAAQRQQNGRRHGSADPAHQAGCRVCRSGSAAKRWCQARNPRTTEAGESESHPGVDFPHRARKVEGRTGAGPVLDPSGGRRVHSDIGLGRSYGGRPVLIPGNRVRPVEALLRGISGQLGTPRRPPGPLHALIKPIATRSSNAAHPHPVRL